MVVMKESGIKWAPSIAESFTTKRLKYILLDRNEKNNPIITTNILSLTAKQGVVPLAEKEGGGNKPKEDLSLYRVARPGDIVMNCMNVISGSVAMSNYLGCLSPVYYTFRTIKPEDEERFFNYIFQTTQFQRSLVGFANGILIKESSNGKLNTIRLRVSTDMLGSLFVPYTSPKNQKRIADFLDSKCAEIDALSADIQSEIDTLEAYKRSKVFDTVMHGLNHDRFIEVDSDVWTTIPEGWKLVDIKYLFEIVKRIAGKEGYNIIAITQQGLKYKDISSNEGQIASDYSGYQFVYPGDYAMNHMDLLTGWVDLSDKFGVTSPDYRVFRLRYPEYYDRKYYKYIMQCCYMNRIFYTLGQGVSNLGRWRLQTSTFNNFKVPVPPYEEQVRLGQYLENEISQINEIIAQKQEQLAVLAEYKKSIIYEYVTGKKEVPSV